MTLNALRSSAAALLICCLSRTAHADGEPNSSAHRVGLSMGLGVTLASADIDGHWRTSSEAPGLALDYAYGATSFLEIGASIRYWNFGAFSNQPSSSFNEGEDGIHHAILPSAQVRLHTRGRLELGLTLGVGALVLVQPRVPDNDTGSKIDSHTWVGAQGSVGIDVRYWVDRHWAIFAAPTLVVGHATDHGEIRGFYLSKDAIFGGLHGWLGVVVAP
jgi:hypothetical protein